MYSSECGTIEAHNPCGAIEGYTIFYIVLAGETYHRTPFAKLSKVPSAYLKQGGEVGEFPS